MRKIGKNALISLILGVSSLSIMVSTPAHAQHPYAKTNHSYAKQQAKINHKRAKQLRKMRRNQSRFQQPVRYANFGDWMQNRQLVHMQQPAPPPGPTGMFQQWVEYEPQYQLYPGDQIDVVVQSAPELSRTLTVGPDGRITMPMSAPIMAAGRSLPYVQDQLKAELAKQLRDPTVAVTSRAFAPQQIFIGGQVGQQGSYTIPGPIGSLEAILMAGGFLPSAKTTEVVVLRRAPNGGLMMRVINHKHGMKNIRSYADNMQLRRGDIIFVPRSNISEVGLFVQQYFRDALPFTLGLSYNLGDGFSGNN
ncbi:MAG: polysaccharide export protein [Acidimicrobiales bacterium]|nr:MAG: polysaccharide export protein [Acidimicrobiales bacterium]